MRCDKFLWAVRVFKTRTLSSSRCKEGKVFIGEETVKPSRTLKIGDVITVRKGAIHFQYEVIAFPKNRVGAKLVEEYCNDCTTAEEIEKFETIKLAQKSRPRGLGRPTKRERRDLDKYFE